MQSNKAGNKSPASAEDFNIAATTAVRGNFDDESEGYATVSVLDSLDNKKMFKDVIVCPIDESNSVYYYMFKNKGDAKSFFAGNARKLKEVTKDAVDDKISQENLENYSYYIASAGGRYVSIIRVNKTVFYANVEEIHTDKVQEIVKMLNY